VLAGVLIPVKAFHVAKRRLAGILSDEQRAALARWMAERVVAAAGPLPVFVVCDDPDVRAWATHIGVTPLWTPSVGLNAAVAIGVGQLRDRGIDHVVIAHSDLPLANDLAKFATHDGVTLVTDKQRNGTNVLGVPTSQVFEFHYGHGSFQAHLHEAHLLGLALHVLHDDDLALDVDTPEDFTDPRIQELLPEWAQTSLVSPK
jgi:2-phospho-L-lactate/phosphoenolpyruvate guanylyltransferase